MKSFRGCPCQHVPLYATILFPLQFYNVCCISRCCKIFENNVLVETMRCAYIIRPPSTLLHHSMNIMYAKFSFMVNIQSSEYFMHFRNLCFRKSVLCNVDDFFHSAKIICTKSVSMHPMFKSWKEMGRVSAMTEIQHGGLSSRMTLG